MSRFNHKLPETLIPEDDICCPLFIPNHPDYINLVIRALRMLTLDRHYERDDTKSALIVRDQFDTRMYQPFIDALSLGTDCGSGELTEEGDCLAYPLYAPFIDFKPFNPFTDTTIPDGYAYYPFVIHDGGGSFPPEYNDGDIIVPLSSVNLDPFDLFTGDLTRIEISVIGNGQIELDLLAMPQGGRALIGVGKQPNFTDIISGIFDPNTETILELEVDSSSFPMEDDISVQHEININAGAGVKTIVYITFLPVLDFDLIPFKYGGGIRSVQLCGFENEASEMGITNIRWTDCELEFFINGEWQTAEGLSDSCIVTEDELNTALVPINNTISQNENDIATNTANIATNTTNIATNAANIVIEHDRIDLNIIAIGDLNNLTDDMSDTLDDHEDRITALEASGGGGIFETKTVILNELIGDVTLEGNGTRIDFDGNALDLSAYDNLFVTFDGISTGSFLYLYIALATDADITPLSNTLPNYNSSINGSGTASWAAIAWLRGDSTHAEFTIFDINGSDEKIVSGTFVASGAPNAVPFNGVSAVAWENVQQVDKFVLWSSAASIAAGARMRVYGQSVVDILVATPESEEWEAFIDFRVDDFDDIVTVVNGNGYQGDHYQGNNGGSYDGCRIQINFTASDITRIVMEYYKEPSTGGIAWIRENPNPPPFIAEDDPPIPNVISFLDTGDIDENMSNIQVNVNGTLDGLSNHDDRIYSIRIFGQGTIPEELEAYEI